MKTALVVIDVQKGMFADPDLPPYEGEAVVGRIAALIERARAEGAPIYFVQHDGGPSHPFHEGKPGFAFHERIAPRGSDDVTVKNHGSAFKNTDLDAKLRKAGVEQLVIAGMQSEYCVDSAVRGAVERGYQGDPRKGLPFDLRHKGSQSWRDRGSRKRDARRQLRRVEDSRRNQVQVMRLPSPVIAGPLSRRSMASFSKFVGNR